MSWYCIYFSFSAGTNSDVPPPWHFHFLFVLFLSQVDYTWARGGKNGLVVLGWSFFFPPLRSSFYFYLVAKSFDLVYMTEWTSLPFVPILCNTNTSTKFLDKQEKKRKLLPSNLDHHIFIYNTYMQLTHLLILILFSFSKVFCFRLRNYFPVAAHPRLFVHTHTHQSYSDRTGSVNYKICFSLKKNFTLSLSFS